MNRCRINYGLIIIVISIIISLLIIFYSMLYCIGRSVGMVPAIITGVIAIIVAIIGVAAGIWTQVVQFKKDGQRIENVNNSTQSVKEDTIYIKPKIDNILDNTKVVNEYVLRKGEKIEGAANKIDELLEAKKLDDKIKERVSASIGNPDYIQNALKLVYEKNAALEDSIAKAKTDNLLLNNEVSRLKAENTRLIVDNRVLREENEKYSQIKQIDSGIEKEMNKNQYKDRGHEHTR